MTLRPYLLGTVALCLLAGTSAQAQTLLVNSNAANVIQYDGLTGAPIGASSSSVTVQGITHDNSGSFYTANFNTDSVGKYDISTGALINSSLVTGIDEATGIVFNNGSLFVASFSTGTVGQYDATTGAAINASLITGLNKANTLAIYGGNLYIVETPGVGGAVKVYTTSGAVVNSSLVSLSSANGGIAFSGSSMFLTNGGTVGVYDALTGAAINTSLITGLNNPFSLAINDNGNLLVAEFSAQKIREYSITGTLLNADFITVSNPISMDVVSVPEPSTYVLIGFGILAVLMVRTRVTRRASSIA